MAEDDTNEAFRKHGVDENELSLEITEGNKWSHIAVEGRIILEEMWDGLNDGHMVAFSNIIMKYLFS
jgi:hypothetical protein